MRMYWRLFSRLSPLPWVGANGLRAVWMNALVGFQENVQEDEQGCSPTASGLSKGSLQTSRLHETYKPVADLTAC
jgi:hypothetical protein